MIVDKRSREKYLLAMPFDFKVADEIIKIVLNEAEYIDLHIEGEKSFLEFKICFSNEAVRLNHGDYLLKAEKTIPGTMPPLHLYKSVCEREFSRNFKPLSVTE